MPAATNILQIDAIDDAIDTALAAQIAAYGVPAFQPRSREDRPDIFALTLFTRGPSNGHLHKLPVGSWAHDMFEGCTVSVEIFAPRIVDETTPEGQTVIAETYDILGELAARVRQSLSYGRGNELNARLDYHHVTHLVPLADVRGFDEERKLDRHQLSWRCTAGVKPEAWPADPAAYDVPPRAT